jgi:hypothetical protein
VGCGQHSRGDTRSIHQCFAFASSCFGRMQGFLGEIRPRAVGVTGGNGLDNSPGRTRATNRDSRSKPARARTGTVSPTGASYEVCMAQKHCGAMQKGRVPKDVV